LWSNPLIGMTAGVVEKSHSIAAPWLGHDEPSGASVGPLCRMSALAERGRRAQPAMART
jgi:hypothetical protein